MSRFPRRHLLMDRILGVFVLGAATFAVSFPLLDHFLS